MYIVHVLRTNDFERINKMEQLKVTVIVPIYNVEQYVGKCIKSILEQTYNNLEIILVDDCSKDDSLSICKKYAETDERIKILQNDKNSGVSFSRNRALQVAAGYYITMIDSDDWIEKNYVELMVKAIEKTDADACVCGYIKEFENKSSKRYQIKSETSVEKNTDILDCAMQKNIPFVGYVWAKLYKKDILDDIELKFDTAISLCEDSLFNYSYFDSIKNCVIIKECLYHYRIRAESATNTATAEKIKTKLYAFQKALDITKKYPNSVFYYRINATIFNTSIQYINVFFAKGIKIPHDEYERILNIAKDALYHTKIKYTTKEAIFRYYLLLLSPRILGFALRVKEGIKKSDKKVI